MNNFAAVTHTHINDLRIKKQAAIDVLDFETAETIENQIQEELNNFAKVQISDVLLQAKQEADRLEKQFDQRLQDEAEISRQNTQKIFTKYQVIVEDLEQQHVDQLMENENERAYTLIQESEQDIEEQLQLLEEAKKEASLSNFAKAKELRQQARDVAEAELERRRKETEEKYQKIKEETIQKQKEELNDLAKQHEEEVNQEKISQEAVFRKTQEDIVSSFRIIAKTAIARFRAVSSNAENIEKATKEITEHTEKIVNKFKTQQRVIPELANSEKMRLASMPPTAFLETAQDAVIPSVAESAVASRGVTANTTMSRSITANSTMSRSLNPSKGKSRCTSVGLLSRRPMSKAGCK